jgi:hypothetical protein
MEPQFEEVIFFRSFYKPRTINGDGFGGCAMRAERMMIRVVVRRGLSRAALPQRVSTKTCPCIAENRFSCAF